MEKNKIYFRVCECVCVCVCVCMCMNELKYQIFILQKVLQNY